MRSSWRVARIMGIDISVDFSWFIILFLMVYSLGFVEFPRELHPRSFFPRFDVVSVSLGIAASLMLFASVLAHELSHCWMAIQRGIPVSGITLFIFGGIAQIADEPDRPASEFLIAIMGPLMSLALAAVFGAAWIWLRIVDDASVVNRALLPLVLLAGIVAQANGALALFNLAPGFPLDGGRVFRAILWALFHDVRRATRWATRAGQGIAVLLVLAGIFLFLTELDGGGIWYALIGLFLWNAAREGYRQMMVRETLRQVKVEQLMTRTVETVAPETPLNDFVIRYVIPRREQTFAISSGQAVQGFVSLVQAQRVPRREWPTRCVQEIMIPRDQMPSLSPQQDASRALGILSRSNTDELPVMSDGTLVGFLGRAELARFLKLKVEF
jgi:Zn-dependent protease